MTRPPKVNINLLTKTPNPYPVECHSLPLNAGPDVNQRAEPDRCVFIEELCRYKGRSVVADLGMTVTAIMWSVTHPNLYPFRPLVRSSSCLTSNINSTALCQLGRRQQSFHFVRHADGTRRFVKVQLGRSQAARRPQAALVYIYRCPLLR